MDQRILDNFLSLTRIPRKSHHEEAVSRFLYQWALEKGLSACRDQAGNVIVDKPASPGCENAPRTILQGHMDMVCVAEPGRDYDPLCDPIRVINNGETLTADGTSLGADDGAGVALAMTILEDPDAVHGPIRGIFTVDEEDGMAGATALDGAHLDAGYLINLDWEEFGSLCCSSAGSDMYSFRRDADWSSAEGLHAYALTLTGFEGGHSGAQIHLGRANAIRVAARILRAAANAGCSLRLASFQGGSAHNAIPSHAEAVVCLSPEQEDAFLAAARAETDLQLELCGATDPGAVVTLLKTDAASRALSAEMSRDVLDILTSVHDGVFTMSPAIEGLVESSANTGLCRLSETAFTFMVHQRSSQAEITHRMKADYLRLAGEFGFAMEVISSSPAWPVKPGSELVEICRKCFRGLTGREIRVEPIHAGLECGAFAEKNPALDIISIGPELRDIHSPKETLVLASLDECDGLVRAVLKDIAGK